MSNDFEKEVEKLIKEGKIPENTKIIKTPPTAKDDGQFVAFQAQIGETSIKLAPPIALVGENEIGKYPTSYTTKFLDFEARVENSYLYVSFKRSKSNEEILNYFNNLMALFNIIFIPLDFISPFDLIIHAKGMGTPIEFLSSSKAHSRGYGIDPVEIDTMEFSKIVMLLWGLWEKIKKSKYLNGENIYQLLGQSINYFFNENYFNSFVNGWIFIESSINMLWRELILETFSPTGTKSGTPLADERNWTTQIKIDELFMKGIIDSDFRKKLHKLRRRRNSIFHSDENITKRTTTRDDASGAVQNGLVMFYKMLDENTENIPAFIEIKDSMYHIIHRGTIHRTIVKEKEIK